MKTRWSAVTALWVAALLSTTAWAETYYVDTNHPSANDSNLGTEAFPWNTIQKAADNAKAGDTVYVKTGTYNERVVMKNSGANNNKIVFKSLPRRTAQISRGIYNNKDYIRVEGFNITDSVFDEAGIDSRGNYLEIVDNYFFDVKAPAIYDLISAKASHTYIGFNKIYKCQYGVKVCSNALVEYNDIERLYDWGAGDCDYTRGFGDSIIIRNNYFHGTLKNEIGNAHVDGFQTFSANGEYATNVLIENNRVFDYDQGLMIASAEEDHIYNIIIRGNIFADGWAWGGSIHDYIHNVFIFNNTFANIAMHGIGIRFNSSAVVMNNAFYKTNTSYWFDGAGASIVGDYNMIYEARNPTQVGSHDIIGKDPLFANPIPGIQSDFHLQQGSPCIDAGGFLTTITSAGGFGTQFTVADAGHFTDGWGIEHVQGDEIQLYGTTQRARIITVNYETNVITVDRILTWTQNQGISLAYQGTAPDLGAHEYVPGLSLDSPAGGELWVRGFGHAITWSSSGVTEPVKIGLLKAGVLNQVIAENQAVADGSYAWQIPANQATGDDYTVKLTAGIYSDTSGVFTIAAPSAPVVQTLAAQSVTSGTAVLRGTVHPMGLEAAYYFEYGLTSSYGSRTAEMTLAAGDAITSVRASIAGLTASTTYHFRLVANNNIGTSEGDDMTFTTSGGGSGGGSGDSGGGGGGGGCFIAAVAQGSVQWSGLLPLFLLGIGLVGWNFGKKRKNL